LEESVIPLTIKPYREMKTKRFIVKFTNGDYVIVDAIGGQEAQILAQAEQIKAGRSYDTLSVSNCPSPLSTDN
jgi:hypothetical protein